MDQTYVLFYYMTAVNLIFHVIPDLARSFAEQSG